MYDKDNTFAKIARNEIPRRTIVENKYAVSFYDANPKFEKHALVIPKGEYENILDFVRNASQKEQKGFWDCFLKTAEKLGLKENFNVLINTGANAPMFKQSIFHFHLHLLAGAKKLAFEKLLTEM